MDAPETDLVSTGHLARRFGCSMSAVKKWEREGRLVPATRVLGSDRRVWRVSDLATLEEQVGQLLRVNGHRRTKEAPMAT